MQNGHGYSESRVQARGRRGYVRAQLFGRAGEWARKTGHVEVRCAVPYIWYEPGCVCRQKKEESKSLRGSDTRPMAHFLRRSQVQGLITRLAGTRRAKRTTSVCGTFGTARYVHLRADTGHGTRVCATGQARRRTRNESANKESIRTGRQADGQSRQDRQGTNVRHRADIEAHRL